MLSSIRLLVTPWTIACQAPLSMGFSQQEYWSGLPFSPPGDLPDPGIKLELTPLNVSCIGATWEALCEAEVCYKLFWK